MKKEILILILPQTVSSYQTIKLTGT